jgi:hypothetical protein
MESAFVDDSSLFWPQFCDSPLYFALLSPENSAVETSSDPTASSASQSGLSTLCPISPSAPERRGRWEASLRDFRHEASDKLLVHNKERLGPVIFSLQTTNCASEIRTVSQMRAALRP